MARGGWPPVANYNLVIIAGLWNFITRVMTCFLNISLKTTFMSPESRFQTNV